VDRRLRERLRELDPDSAEALLLRLRAGDLSERRLRVAALLGHPAAAEIEEPNTFATALFRDYDIQRAVGDLLAPQQRASYVADIAESTLEMFEDHVGAFANKIFKAIKIMREYAENGSLECLRKALLASAEELQGSWTQLPGYDLRGRLAIYTIIEAVEAVEREGSPAAVLHTMRSQQDAAYHIDTAQTIDHGLRERVRAAQRQLLARYILGTAGPRVRSNPDEPARKLERSFETIEEEQAHLLNLLRAGEISPMGYAAAHALLFPAAAEETPQTYGAWRLNMGGKSLRSFLSTLTNNKDLGGMHGSGRITRNLIVGLARAIRRYLPVELSTIGEEYAELLATPHDDPDYYKLSGKICDRVEELLELIPVVDEEWPRRSEVFWGWTNFNRHVPGLAEQRRSRWQQQLRELHSLHINPVRGAAFEAMRELLYAIGAGISNEYEGNCLGWSYGWPADRLPLALDHALMIGPSRRRPYDPFYEDFLYTLTKPAVDWILFDPTSPWRPGGPAANTPYRIR